jgi:hypothetical protein
MSSVLLTLLLLCPLFCIWRVVIKKTRLPANPNYNLASLAHSIMVCLLVQLFASDFGGLLGSFIKMFITVNSIAYFIADSITAVRNGDRITIIHHGMAIHLFLYGYLASLPIRFAIMLMTIELSTPFLNLMFIAKHHRCESLEKICGAFLVITFTVCRIIMIPVMIYQYWEHLGQLLITLPVIYALCVWWWVKIMAGFKKVVFREGKVL